MNRVIKHIGYLLLSVIIALQSCLDSIIIEPEPNGESDAMVPIALDLGGILRTYGPDYPNVKDSVASSMENTVQDIIVYIFDQTFTCEKILVGSTSPVGPELVKVGTKHIIAVVNAQANVSSLYPVPTANPSSVSYPVLKQKLSDAKTALPASPFLMVGERMNVPVTEQRPDTNPYKVTIDVERAVAKVTMHFTKSGKALAHNVTLQRVTLFNGANKIYLMNKPITDDITYTLTSSKNVFNPNAVVQNTPTYVSLADSFYTYASYCGKDTSKAVRFEVEAAINSPFNIRKATFFLASYVVGTDTTYDIRRNYWYDVKVNIKDPGMDSLYITITACPWNMADTIVVQPGVGAEINTALPFKLVKNFTYSEMLMTSPTAPNSSYAAIRSHSKGASWFDMTVTAGATWGFGVKDNSPRNQGVYYSLDSANWHQLTTTGITGTGDDSQHRVYIYRPYREDEEPLLGPSLFFTVNGLHKQDLIIQGRDTIPIPINSYILRPELSGAPLNKTRAYIPLAGVIRHWEDHILNNGQALQTNLPLTADLLWRDVQNQDVIKNPISVTVINPLNQDSAYLLVEAGVPGNAVVVVRIGAMMIWSFHIWVTDYDPYQAAGQKLYTPTIDIKNVFMDRNLGAMSNTYDAAGNARGLYYQFGRKDPFPRTPNWTSGVGLNSFLYYNVLGQMTLNPVAVPTASTTLRPKTALQYAINNPTRFFTTTGSQNWSLIQENANLWHTPKGKKTAYDPCPEGWRVPYVPDYYVSLSPWIGEIIDNVPPNGFLAPNNAVQNGVYSPLVGYYPFSGYLHHQTSLVQSTETHSLYWTSATNGLINGGLTNGGAFAASFANINALIDAEMFRGFSVRCVVDKDYIQNKENGGLFGAEVIKLKEKLLP